jgi:hypothetical protein
MRPSARRILYSVGPSGSRGRRATSAAAALGDSNGFAGGQLPFQDALDLELDDRDDAAGTAELRVLGGRGGNNDRVRQLDHVAVSRNDVRHGEKRDGETEHGDGQDEMMKLAHERLLSVDRTSYCTAATGAP